ncbi:MAG: hypothetical protein ACI87E_001542, partial [Mariniblastus sp.]
QRICNRDYAHRKINQSFFNCICLFGISHGSPSMTND